MKVDPPAQLWDRRKGESTKAFGYFRRYLEMGEIRSFEALSAEVGKTTNAIRITAHRHRWTQRTAAYDAAARADVDREAVRTARTLYDDHREALALMRQVGLAGMNRALKNKRVTPAESARILEAAIRLERLMIGEATERTEARVGTLEGLDFGELDDAEVRQLRTLINRARRAG